MPHFCDDCGYEFPKGSDEMLSGCPDCGGRRFQYVAEGGSPQPSVDADQTETDDSDIIEAGPTTTETESPEDAAQHAARSGMIDADADDSSYAGSVSDLVSGLQSSRDDDHNPNDSEGADEADQKGVERATSSSPAEAETDGESADHGPDETDSTEDETDSTEDETDSTEDETDSTEEEQQRGEESSRRVTSADEVRAELQDQFESIKIREPGSYELNLKKLFEREEHIIEIQENGKYVIQMPER